MTDAVKPAFLNQAVQYVIEHLRELNVPPLLKITLCNGMRSQAAIDLLIPALVAEVSSLPDGGITFFKVDSEQEALSLISLFEEQAKHQALNKALEYQESYALGISAEALGNTNSEQTINTLIQDLESQDPYKRERAAGKLEKIGNPQPLAKLWQMLLQSGNPNLLSTIAAIQKRCGFYNYEIAQAAVDEGKRVKGEGKKEEIQTVHNTYIHTLENLNAGMVGNINIEPKIQGDQVGVKYVLPKDGESSD